jgi:hypothetical protein
MIMKYFDKEKLATQERYVALRGRLADQYKNFEQDDSVEGAYFDYWLKWAKKLVDLEEEMTPSYFLRLSMEELMERNHALYHDLLPDQYGSSYVNPVYMVKVFGKDLGQGLAYLGALLRGFIHYAYSHQTHRLASGLELLFDLIEQYQNEKLTRAALEASFRDYSKATMDDNSRISMDQYYSKSFDFYTEIIKTSDLSDLRYLFKFGSYITTYEIETANFLNAYDSQTLDTVSKAVAKAYVEGFKRDGKDVGLRHNVRMAVNVGQEQLTLRMIDDLKAYNLEGFVYDVVSTEYNKQYGYDHKFDLGMVLTKEWADQKLASLKMVASNAETMLRDYSGILYVERFGEDPFSPKSNDDRIKLSEDQQGLYQFIQNEQRQLTEVYIPEQERSFCIVAFPTPEIGDEFEAIFEDTLKINMLDSDFYEAIQGKIIDALDQGNQVRVLGKGNNLTDITVALQTLNNPEKETNFVNCVADVNIPVGEVFTSPVLKGTNGLLHIENVYLEGFNFENLKLWFVDGYIDRYECSNFQDMEKGKEFIKENLLFPHKTLPIGEFAIGTNTLAYVIAEKYGIVDKLPILIVEKMGPHFAIGDTCFSWSEDTPVYNQLDGKEIIARDNEHSILRKKDVSKAYTNCHTDITIPYDALEEIAVITHTGEKVEIIKDGRFVLAGTEALNAPFDN